MVFHSLPKSYVIGLRQRLDTEIRPVDDRIYPGASLVERRLEEVDEGMFETEPLSQVPSLIAAQEKIIQTTLAEGRDGSLKVRKLAVSIDLPTDPEELRSRIKTLAISYRLASLRHVSNRGLQGMNLRC